MAVQDMNPAALATEAIRYLEAIDLFRSIGLEVGWRPEAEELGPPSPGVQMPRLLTCELCACSRVRINGRHVCVQPSTGPRRSA